MSVLAVGCSNCYHYLPNRETKRANAFREEEERRLRQGLSNTRTKITSTGVPKKQREAAAAFLKKMTTTKPA